MTFLPARKPMAEPSRLVKIGPAAIGRAAPKVRRWLATSTVEGYATTQPRVRGIRRTHHEGRMAAAARPTSAALAATGCSSALRLTDTGWGHAVPGSCFRSVVIKAPPRRGFTLEDRPLQLRLVAESHQS